MFVKCLMPKQRKYNHKTTAAAAAEAEMCYGLEKRKIKTVQWPYDPFTKYHTKLIFVCERIWSRRGAGTMEGKRREKKAEEDTVSIEEC